MKNLTLIITLLVMALTMTTSCEKPYMGDITGVSDGDEEPNLVLRVVTTDAKAMTRADGDAFWNRLNFAIYQNGKKVKGVNQVADDDSYGQVELTLEAGTYQVLVLAHSSDGNPTTTDAEKIQFTNALGFSDTFYYYGSITVTRQQQTHNITLNRVTAMLRFIINDEIPANVSNLKFYYTGGSGALNATTGYGCVDSKQTVVKVIDRTSMTRPYSFDLYTIPKEPTAKLNLTVTAYDETQTVIYEREFKGIGVETNKITEFSGNFFINQPTPGDDDPHSGEQPTAGNDIFLISANTDWAGTISHSY